MKVHHFLSLAVLVWAAVSAIAERPALPQPGRGEGPGFCQLVAEGNLAVTVENTEAGATVTLVAEDETLSEVAEHVRWLAERAEQRRVGGQGGRHARRPEWAIGVPPAHAVVTSGDGWVSLSLSGDAPEEVAAIQTWGEHFAARVATEQCQRLLEPEED
jgi:hypothetical protein